MMEYSNLLWAWATSDRADRDVFNVVGQAMISSQEEFLTRNKGTPADVLEPQVWSNAMWAFATAGMAEESEEMVSFLAHLLDAYPEFVANFKPQHISNTLWAVAKLLSNKAE